MLNIFILLHTILSVYIIGVIAADIYRNTIPLAYKNHFMFFLKYSYLWFIYIPSSIILKWKFRIKNNQRRKAYKNWAKACICISCKSKLVFWFILITGILCQNVIFVLLYILFTNLMYIMLPRYIKRELKVFKETLNDPIKQMLGGYIFLPPILSDQSNLQTKK